MDVLFLAARILLAVPFVLSGLSIHFSREGVEYARAYKAPAPGLMVPLSGAAIVLGGLLVALGVWGDFGALVLFYAFNQLQGEAGLSITDPLFSRGG